jgi:hypothetical protein
MREGELEYAKEACGVPPLSGILRSDRSTFTLGKTNMLGWNIEFKKEFFEIPAQKYTEYSALWEIHHQDLERACRDYQICKAQNRTLGSCSQRLRITNENRKARAFMILGAD